MTVSFLPHRVARLTSSIATTHPRSFLNLTRIKPSIPLCHSTINQLIMSTHSHFLNTSGETDSVWIHTEPYSNRPQFDKLSEDARTDVCVIGSGIAGVSVSYELVSRGVKVIMLEAREVVSGESGLSTQPFMYDCSLADLSQGEPVVIFPPASTLDSLN